jgi:hypothetical protein
MAFTKEDRINTVFGGGGHVVILGAGASIASTRRNPLSNGKLLPSMDNFIEVVGLTDIVSGLPVSQRATNFEELYNRLHQTSPNSTFIREIEKRVFNYFEDMRLPKMPTIYDYLVLSLRPRDLIATFNWDPFLYQAFVRNHEIAEMPYLCFLHGNVAIGFNKEEKRSGPAGGTHKETYRYYEPTKLLYPVAEKNYTNDFFINMEWQRVKAWLHSKDTRLVTIFGYGAPKTDVEAVKLLNEAWGTPEKRDMEQFEIIDIRPENEVRKQWNSFIHSHHYDYTTQYFSSSLAHNPRRTSESYFQHIEPLSPDEAFSASNPVPDNFVSLKELWDWHKGLIEAENRWKEKHSNDKS